MKDWRDIDANTVYQALQECEPLVDLVVSGKKRMQMLCSVAGLGKTYIVEKALKRHGIDKKDVYATPNTPQSFIIELWRKRDSLFYIEESNFIAEDLALSNIAKMAWYSKVVTPLTSMRVVLQRNQRYEGDERYNPDLPPYEPFELGPKHGLLWNTNKNFADKTNRKAKTAECLEALESRGLDPIWIPDDPQELFNYMLWLATWGGMLRNAQVSLEASQAVVDFICKNGKRLIELSPRLVMELAQSHSYPNYQAVWARTKLAPTEKFPNLIIPDNVKVLEERKPVQKTARKLAQPVKATEPSKPDPEPNPPVAAPKPAPATEPEMAPTSAEREKYVAQLAADEAEYVKAPFGSMPLPAFPTGNNPLANPILSSMLGGSPIPKRKTAGTKPTTRKAAAEIKRVDSLVKAIASAKKVPTKETSTKKVRPTKK